MTTYNFTVKVTDSMGATATVADSITTSLPIASTVYVASYGNSRVEVINPTNNTVTTTVPVGAGPVDLVLSPDNLKLYVTNAIDGTVSVISTATNTVIGTLTGSNMINTEFAAISSELNRLYVSGSSSDNVTVFNMANDTEITTIEDVLFSSPRVMAVLDSADKLYVADKNASKVFIVSTASNAVTGDIAVPSAYDLALSPDGSTLWVTENVVGGKIKHINTATDVATDMVMTTAYPRGIAISPDGAKVYAVDYGGTSGSVTVIDAIAKTVITTVAVGSSPFHVYVSPDSTRAFVVNVGGDNVSVIDTTSYTVVATVTVGDSPKSVTGF